METSEPKRAVVADKSVLVVRPPRGFFEPVARIEIEPAPWKPVLLGAPLRRDFTKPPHQGRAGNLVSIDSEDPLARALRVQPGEVPLDLRDSDAKNPVGGCSVLLKPVVIGARIGGDHDLVRYRPKRPEHCRHARA